VLSITVGVYPPIFTSRQDQPGPSSIRDVGLLQGKLVFDDVACHASAIRAFVDVPHMIGPGGVTRLILILLTR
jgi:hypothetical protein